MDVLQASESMLGGFYKVQLKYCLANALIQQAELSVTVWQGNWAEIGNTQVNMCENTHTHAHTFSLSL